MLVLTFVKSGQSVSGFSSVVGKSIFLIIGGFRYAILSQGVNVLSSNMANANKLCVSVADLLTTSWLKTT